MMKAFRITLKQVEGETTVKEKGEAFGQKKRGITPLKKHNITWKTHLHTMNTHTQRLHV